MARNPVISSVTQEPVTVTVVSGPYVQELQVCILLRFSSVY